MCKQVVVNPTTSTTRFDVTITDEDDVTVRSFTDVVCVNDLTEWPAYGIYTVAISSATADEVFEVMLFFVT